MKKKQQGILSVEASFVLTACTLFILFLFSFARVYSAQSMVSHAVLQATDAIALESYVRETNFRGDTQEIVDMANKLNGSTSINSDSFTSLRSANLPNVAKQKFAAAISDTSTKADEKLEDLGVKYGIDGVDFSRSEMDLGNDDVILCADYVVELQFPVFGFKEIKFTKSAKAKTFGDILFDIGVEVDIDPPGAGSASGGGSFKYGTQIVIQATANYGYKFHSWNDGNESPERTVTVTGSTKYVAKFEKDSFAINVKPNNTAYGTVTPSSKEYEYLEKVTINAIPKEGYHFVNWTIEETNPERTYTVGDSNHTSYEITVDQIYHCTANFEPNKYKLAVKCEGITDQQHAKIFVNDILQNREVTLPYNTSFKITATTDIPGYRFQGWKIMGESQVFTPSEDHFTTIPARNLTYIAVYRPNYKVTLDANGGTINGKTTEEHTIDTNTLDTNTFPFSQYKPYYNGHTFQGWFWGDTNQFNDQTPIVSNVTAKAKWSCRHQDDAGNTWWVPDSTHNGKVIACDSGQVTYTCSGCKAEKVINYTGTCSYNAWCGDKHEYYADGLSNVEYPSYECGQQGAASGENHEWKYYACITCEHCGRIKNARNYKHVYRAGKKSKWCYDNSDHPGGPIDLQSKRKELLNQNEVADHNTFNYCGDKDCVYCENHRKR